MNRLYSDCILISITDVIIVVFFCECEVKDKSKDY